MKQPALMKPKGKLLIIGGAEYKGFGEEPEMTEENRKSRPFEILKELVPEDRRNGSIEVITTATKVPEEVGKEYQEAFRLLGFKNVNLLNIQNREEAGDSKTLKRIEDAETVFFSGGDQFRLTTILGDTPLVKLLEKKYHENSDFMLAGTSAGAMAMAKTMILEGQSGEAMLKGDVKIGAGLGFLDKCIIDSHFIKRGRFARLTQALITNPVGIGIGLGEDTALIVRDGNLMECLGSGMVMILDGSKIKHTNIANAKDKMPLCVENLILHILIKGNGFLLEEREFIPDREDIRRERTGKAA